MKERPPHERQDRVCDQNRRRMLTAGLVGIGALLFRGCERSLPPYERYCRDVDRTLERYRITVTPVAADPVQHIDRCLARLREAAHRNQSADAISASWSAWVAAMTKESAAPPLAPELLRHTRAAAALAARVYPPAFFGQDVCPQRRVRIIVGSTKDAHELSATVSHDANGHLTIFVALPDDKDVVARKLLYLFHHEYFHYAEGVRNNLPEQRILAIVQKREPLHDDPMGMGAALYKTTHHYGACYAQEGRLCGCLLPFASCEAFATRYGSKSPREDRAEFAALIMLMPRVMFAQKGIRAEKVAATKQFFWELSNGAMDEEYWRAYTAIDNSALRFTWDTFAAARSSLRAGRPS